MTTNHSEWTPKIVEHLKSLVGDGFSASQIAKQIVLKFGIQYSRNAIIGKVTRIGLKLCGQRQYEVKTKTVKLIRSKAVKEFKKKFNEQAKMTAEEMFIGELGKLPVVGGCAYVVGALSTMKACGQPVAINTRGRKTCYCEYHTAVVYQKGISVLNCGTFRRASDAPAGAPRGIDTRMPADTLTAFI